MTGNLRDDPTLAGVVDDNTPDELIDPTLLFAKTARDTMIATGDRHVPELILLAARVDALLDLVVDTVADVHDVARVPLDVRRTHADRLRTGVEATALAGATEQLATVIAAFTPDEEPARDPAPYLTPDEFATVRRFDDTPSALEEPTP